MLLHRPFRWREQHDENYQVSWIGCGCSLLNGRSVVPPFHAGDGSVGIRRPCRSQSWTAAYTHERSRGQPQGSSPRVLWCGCRRSRGGRGRGLWCVSLPEGMWVLSESTLLTASARFVAFVELSSTARTSCSTFSARALQIAATQEVRRLSAAHCGGATGAVAVTLHPTGMSRSEPGRHLDCQRSLANSRQLTS